MARFIFCSCSKVMRPEVRIPSAEVSGEFRYYFSCDSGHFAVLSQQEFDELRDQKTTREN